MNLTRTLLQRSLQTSMAFALMTSMALAGDWPAWRGPNRDDISSETGLLSEWPEGGPRKVWTSEAAGLGYSGLAISGGVIYTMGADDSSEYVIALKDSDGSELWKTRIGDFLENGWGGGPRSTPTVVGQNVIAISGKGNVACLNTENGEAKWTASLTELGGSIPNWGYSESALVDGERVLCTPGGKQGTVACFDLNSGKLIWQSADVTENAHYSSIIAVNHFGKKQYIQLTEKKVFGLDAEGKLQWEADWPGRTAVIPTPIYSKGQVYVTSGYGVGCMLLNIGPNNQVEKIYENKVMKNHHGGVILIGDKLYGHSDSVGWVCQDLNSGEEIWSEGGKNGSKGAVTSADGKLYCLEEGSGDCVLAEATPDGWKEISRFTIDPKTKQRSDRGKIWTHPVVCNGKLYLRDQEIICCYDISKP
ncbi:MAG: PQQ-binding-like beta-propeller repeat protein [Planctomycetaceae bacterium]